MKAKLQIFEPKSQIIKETFLEINAAINAINETNAKTTLTEASKAAKTETEAETEVIIAIDLPIITDMAIVATADIGAIMATATTIIKTEIKTATTTAIQTTIAVITDPTTVNPVVKKYNAKKRRIFVYLCKDRPSCKCLSRQTSKKLNDRTKTSVSFENARREDKYFCQANNNSLHTLTINVAPS